jgi:hypothetical protein
MAGRIVGNKWGERERERKKERRQATENIRNGKQAI